MLTPWTRILYDTDWHGLRLGSSLQNMGTRVKFVKRVDPRR